MRDSTTYYCNLGYHLLLLSENSKIPLKNSNGVKQATNNAEQFLSNLSQIPKANLGIAATNCLIIDVEKLSSNCNFLFWRCRSILAVMAICIIATLFSGFRS